MVTRSRLRKVGKIKYHVEWRSAPDYELKRTQVGFKTRKEAEKWARESPSYWQARVIKTKR